MTVKSTEPIFQDYWIRKNKIKKLTSTACFYKKCKQIKDVKLCEFNYKIIHNILICWDKLKKMGLSETDLYSHCGEVDLEQKIRTSTH